MYRINKNSISAHIKTDLQFQKKDWADVSGYNMQKSC